MVVARPQQDEKKVIKSIFGGSQHWKPEILQILGFDLGDRPVTWSAIREWIEIRNCLVHRGHYVDQVFLDLSDVKVAYPYRIGQPFEIVPGEVFRLLWGTERALVRWSRMLGAALASSL